MLWLICLRQFPVQVLSRSVYSGGIRTCERRQQSWETQYPSTRIDRGCSSYAPCFQLTGRSRCCNTEQHKEDQARMFYIFVCSERKHIKVIGTRRGPLGHSLETAWWYDNTGIASTDRWFACRSAALVPFFEPDNKPVMHTCNYCTGRWLPVLTVLIIESAPTITVF